MLVNPPGMRAPSINTSPCAVSVAASAVVWAETRNRASPPYPCTHVQNLFIPLPCTEDLNASRKQHKLVKNRPKQIRLMITINLRLTLRSITRFEKSKTEHSSDRQNFLARKSGAHLYKRFGYSLSGLVVKPHEALKRISAAVSRSESPMAHAMPDCRSRVCSSDVSSASPFPWLFPGSSDVEFSGAGGSLSCSSTVSCKGNANKQGPSIKDPLHEHIFSQRNLTEAQRV